MYYQYLGNKDESKRKTTHGKMPWHLLISNSSV